MEMNGHFSIYFIQFCLDTTVFGSTFKPSLKKITKINFRMLSATNLLNTIGVTPLAGTQHQNDVVSTSM